MKKKTLPELIQESGHNLHMRVAAVLRGAGFDVTISPTYRDDATNIVRETDILASYSIHNFPREKIWFAIECKNLTEAVGFYNDNLSSPHDLDLAVRLVQKQYGANFDLGKSLLHLSELLFELTRQPVQLKRLFVPDRPLSEACFECIKLYKYQVQYQKAPIFYKWIIVNGSLFSYNTDDYSKGKNLIDIESSLENKKHIFLGFNFADPKENISDNLIEVITEDYLEKRLEYFQIEADEVSKFYAEQKRQEDFRAKL